MSGSIADLIGAQRGANVLDAIAHPAQINPLAGIQAGAEAAKTVMGVRELAGKQAWNDALAASTDANGQTDYGAAMARMAKSGQLGMGDAATQASPLVNDQLSRGHMLLGMMHGAVGGIDERAPPAQLREQINSTFDRLEAAGAPNVAQERALIPKNDADLPTFVQQLRRSGDAAVNQTGLLYGRREPIQTGAGTAFPVVPPASEGGTPFVGSTDFDKPIIPTVAPDGSQTNISLRDYYKQHNIPIPTGTPPPGAPAGAGGPGLGNGRFPPALRNPSGAAAPPATAPPATAPPATAPPGIPTKIAPATEEALKQRAATSVAKFQAETDNDVQAQSQRAILSNMETDAAQFASGPGVEGVKKFQQGLTTWAPSIARAFGVDPKAVAANEGFDKLAAQIVQQQGANSDHRLDVNIAATPHSGLTPAGISMILHQLEGNADYLRTRAHLAATYSGDKTDYPKFQDSIRDLDPRVFQYEAMSGDEQRSWFKAQSPAAQKAFMKSHAAVDKLMSGGGG